MSLSMAVPKSANEAETGFKEVCERVRNTLARRSKRRSDDTLCYTRTAPRQLFQSRPEDLQSLYYHGEWARWYANNGNHTLNAPTVVNNANNGGRKLRNWLSKKRNDEVSVQAADSQRTNQCSVQDQQAFDSKVDGCHNPDSIIEDSEAFVDNVIGSSYDDSLARCLAIFICCQTDEGPWLTPHKDAWNTIIQHCREPGESSYELRDDLLPLRMDTCRKIFDDFGAALFHHTQLAFTPSVIVEGPMQLCYSEAESTCPDPVTFEESLTEQGLPNHHRIKVWSGHWVSPSGTVDEDVECHRFEVEISDFKNLARWESVRMVLRHRQNILYTTAVQRFHDKVSLYYKRPLKSIQSFMSEQPPETLDGKLSIIKRATDLAGFISDCHNLRHEGKGSYVYDFNISLDNVFVADSRVPLGEEPFKIPDFMIARMKDVNQSTFTLAPRQQQHRTLFTAPELYCMQAEVDTACDTWSFGCLMLELFGWTFGGSAWYDQFRRVCSVNGSVTLFQKDEATTGNTRRRHSVDFREFKLNTKVSQLLDKLQGSINDSTVKTLFCTLSDIITTRALIPSPRDRSSMTDIHGNMLQAFYSALKSPWALQSTACGIDSESRQSDATTLRPREETAHDDFKKTLSKLQSALLEKFVPPEHDISDQFCPHLSPREFFDGKPSEVKWLLRLTCQIDNTMDIDDEEILQKRIVGTNEMDSMSKILATFCMMVSKDDPTSDIDPCSEAWHAFVDAVKNQSFCDRDFPKAADECEKLFGEQKGPYFASKQRRFWPLVIKEGELVDDNRRPMPIVKETQIAQGSIGEVYDCTLAKGAIQSAKGDFGTAERRMARKYLRKEAGQTGPSNEWNLAEILLKSPTKHRNILKVSACVRHDDGSLSLFMDYCETDLRRLMKDKDPNGLHLQPKMFLSKLVNLAGALNYFHTAVEINGSKKVLCHLDLNPENIVVDGNLDSDDYQLKLTDLHVCQIKGVDDDDSSTYTKGPVNEFGVCAPPELDGGAEVATSCDVWSFGCVLTSVFIWCANWSAGVKQFDDKRCENERPDCFFSYENGETIVNPAVSKCLQDAADKMAEDKSLADPFHALHRLLTRSMLRIKPEDRISAEAVYEELQRILEMCNPSNSEPSEGLQPTKSSKLAVPKAEETDKASSGQRSPANSTRKVEIAAQDHQDQSADSAHHRRASIRHLLPSRLQRRFSRGAANPNEKVWSNGLSKSRSQSVPA